MGIAGRIKELRERAQLKPAEFAARLGVKPHLIIDVEREKQRAADDLLSKIVEIFQVDGTWLLTGHEGVKQHAIGEPLVSYNAGVNSEAGYVEVPVYNVRAAAGGGALVHDEQIVDVLKFKSEWIRVELHANPGDLYLIYVDGDSMMPTLMSGDLILVDRRTAASVPREGVYLLRLHDTLIVKRLQRLPDGRINVTSDNHAYAPFSISPNEQDNLAIIGRVVWAGRRM